MRSRDLTRARIRHGNVINLFQENVVNQEGLCHGSLIDINSQFRKLKNTTPTFSSVLLSLY